MNDNTSKRTEPAAQTPKSWADRDCPRAVTAAVGRGSGNEGKQAIPVTGRLKSAPPARSDPPGPGRPAVPPAAAPPRGKRTSDGKAKPVNGRFDNAPPAGAACGSRPAVPPATVRTRARTSDGKEPVNGRLESAPPAGDGRGPARRCSPAAVSTRERLMKTTSASPLAGSLRSSRLAVMRRIRAGPASKGETWRPDHPAGSAPCATRRCAAPERAALACSGSGFPRTSSRAARGTGPRTGRPSRLRGTAATDNRAGTGTTGGHTCGSTFTGRRSFVHPALPGDRDLKLERGRRGSSSPCPRAASARRRVLRAMSRRRRLVLRPGAGLGGRRDPVACPRSASPRPPGRPV